MAISSRASIRGRFRDYSVRKYASSDVEAPCTRNSEDIVRYLEETLGLTLFLDGTNLDPRGNGLCIYLVIIIVFIGII